MRRLFILALALAACGDGPGSTDPDPMPGSLAVIAGDGQADTVTHELAPVTVRVFEDPEAAAGLSFAIVQDTTVDYPLGLPGQLVCVAADPQAGQPFVPCLTSNAEGDVHVIWTLGTVADSFPVQVRAMLGEQPVVHGQFTVVAEPGPLWSTTVPVLVQAPLGSIRVSPGAYDEYGNRIPGGYALDDSTAVAVRADSLALKAIGVSTVPYVARGDTVGTTTVVAYRPQSGAWAHEIVCDSADGVSYIRRDVISADTAIYLVPYLEYWWELSRGAFSLTRVTAAGDTTQVWASAGGSASPHVFSVGDTLRTRWNAEGAWGVLVSADPLVYEMRGEKTNGGGTVAESWSLGEYRDTFGASTAACAYIATTGPTSSAQNIGGLVLNSWTVSRAD